MLYAREYYLPNFARPTSYEIIADKENHLLVKTLYDNERVVISAFKRYTMNDVCALIKAGKALNLDGCYIKGFSYAIIKQECGSDTVLRGFSARGAFFDGDTNFSKARFEAGVKDFRYARFGVGSVDFSFASFTEGDVRFNEMHFGQGKIDFLEARFEKGKVCFERTHFGKGDVDFRKVNFSDGYVDFNRVCFGEGNVDFSNAHFGEGDVDFCKVNFGKGSVYFRDACFGNGGVYFSFANFGEGDVDFKNTRFGDGYVSFRFTRFDRGNADFNLANFSKGDVSFNFANFDEGSLLFNEMIFGEGNVDFRNARFGDGYVFFNDTSFGNGDVDFGNARFGKGNVVFSNTNFGKGKVDFSDTRFGKGGVIFNNTNFGKGNVNFNRSNFGDSGMNFFKAKFGEGDVIFRSITLEEGNVNFHLASLEEGSIYFEHIEFEHNKLNFSHLDAPRATLRFKHCSLYQHDNIRVKELKKLELIDCILERTLLLNSTQDEVVKIHSLCLDDSKNLGKIFIDWKTARDSTLANGSEKTPRINIFTKSFKQYNKQKIRAINLLQAKQFKMLKENFHSIGEYDHEDEAFVEFMRSDRKTRPWFLCFLLWVLDKLGGYGTHPWRLFYWMLGIVVAFWFIFNALNFWDMHYGLKGVTVELFGEELSFKAQFFEITGKHYWWHHYTIGLYISIITFLTIGDSQISPTQEFSSALVSLEAFAGLFLMSYFIVSLVRKTLR